MYAILPLPITESSGRVSMDSTSKVDSRGNVREGFSVAIFGLSANPPTGDEVSMHLVICKVRSASVKSSACTHIL